MSPTLVSVKSEVSAALLEGGAVVALESTLIAHGLPWPDNLETALACEEIVRRAGAVPATIAVLDGRLRVGLTESEIEYIARSRSCEKASRRDLAGFVTREADAATTVSATLWIARTVGVRVAATGGLGGVHRGASESFDISNDLDELARADGCLIVCSGIKSILDLPATLEALETRGVVMLGYRTNTLPAFTTPSSGLPLEVRVDSPGEVAALVRTHRALGLPGAIVAAQEVPADVAISRVEMETALSDALESARKQGITGKSVTPFLLDELRRASGGKSLTANRALIVNNAELAAEVATALTHAARAT
jgi:pseudouridylate synthase